MQKQVSLNIKKRLILDFPGGGGGRGERDQISHLFHNI